MRFATMTQLVANMFTRQPATKTRNRRARPGIEDLEGRQLMHGGPLCVAMTPPHVLHHAVVATPHIPTPLSVPTAKNAADMERTLTTSAPSWFYQGVSASQVSSFLTSNNARLTSLEVEGTSPYTFTVTMVRNTGDYQKAWWWYYGLNQTQLSDRLTANNARLINLQSYSEGGVTKFAAIMVSNTGLDSKAWWYYTNVSTDVLMQKLGANSARLVDVQRLDNGNFNAVMVRSTGVDAKPYWFYTGVSANDALVLSQSNYAQITEFQRQSDGRYTVIMEGNTGARWYYYYGKSAQQLVDLTVANHSRLTGVQSYVVNGQKLFNGVMIVNS
jgi:hypothetical protein